MTYQEKLLNRILITLSDGGQVWVSGALNHCQQYWDRHTSLFKIHDGQVCIFDKHGKIAHKLTRDNARGYTILLIKRNGNRQIIQ